MKAAQINFAKLALDSTVATLILSSLPAKAVEWSAVANTETQAALVDRDSGTEVRPSVLDATTGDPLDVRRLRLAIRPPEPETEPG